MNTVRYMSMFKNIKNIKPLKNDKKYKVNVTNMYSQRIILLIYNLFTKLNKNWLEYEPV